MANGEWAVNAQFAGLNLFAMFQKAFIEKRLLAEARLGLGFSFLAGLELTANKKLSKNDLGGIGVNFNAGLCAKFFILETLFAEVGVEYIFILSQTQSMHLKPAIMIGWIF